MYERKYPWTLCYDMNCLIKNAWPKAEIFKISVLQWNLGKLSLAVTVKFYKTKLLFNPGKADHLQIAMP